MIHQDCGFSLPGEALSADAPDAMGKISGFLCRENFKKQGRL